MPGRQSSIFTHTGYPECDIHYNLYSNPVSNGPPIFLALIHNHTVVLTNLKTTKKKTDSVVCYIRCSTLT